MEMTDDNKEFVFNTLIRWLKDSNFVISDERLIVVTSKLYAKAYLRSDPRHFVEIMSSPGNESHFILRIKLQASEQQLGVYENSQIKENRNLDDKINALIFPQHQIFSISGKSAFLEKAILINQKSIDAKQELILNVSKLIESARKLEIWFNELFSYQGR